MTSPQKNVQPINATKTMNISIIKLVLETKNAIALATVAFLVSNVWDSDAAAYEHDDDTMPKKVVKLIEKDIERLGKAIERDPDNKIKLAKLVKKLDKDAMKIGEAIYANVDQSEIEKIEAEAKKMPEDAEVIKGI